MNLNGQDWGEVRVLLKPLKTYERIIRTLILEIGLDVQVVFKKKKPTGAAAHSEQAVNAALRAGQPVDTVKKYAAGTNKAKAAPVKDAAKLDRETEELHHERYQILLLNSYIATASSLLTISSQRRRFFVYLRVRSPC